MSDVIGESEYPKVRVLKERSREKIEDKMNDLYAKGFRLRGDVKYQYDGGTEKRRATQEFVATMVRDDS